MKLCCRPQCFRHHSYYCRCDQQCTCLCWARRARIVPPSPRRNCTPNRCYPRGRELSTPRITVNASLELCHNELAGSSSRRYSSSSRKRRDTLCHWAPDCRVYYLHNVSGTTLSTGEDRCRRHTCACVRSVVRSSCPPRRFGHRTSSPSSASIRHRRTQ